MTKQPIRTVSESRRTKRRDEWWIVGGVLLALAAALVFTARDAFMESAEEPVLAAKPQAVSRPEAPIAVESVDDLVDDDGETLWVSPTHGPPIDLAYLPPGVEIVLALRPESLASHSEGDKVFDSIMPVAGSGIEVLESLLPNVHGVSAIVIGWNLTSRTKWQWSIVARLSDRRTAAEYISSQFPNALRKDHAGKTYSLVGEKAYFVPDDKDGRTLVISNINTMREIVELDGHAPPLTRDMERLLGHTDASRAATLLFRPATLLSDAGDVLQGAMARLRLPLELFLGDDVSAAAVSLNWGDDYFVELVAVPTLDAKPEALSDTLASRVNQLPESVEEFVLSVAPSPYSRRVVARLPEMVRTLAAYTRYGFDRDAALLRCYLPVAAGHNLLMGAELAAAEARANAIGKHDRPPAEAGSPAAVGERLGRVTSLRFSRDTLETALRMLSEDVGVPIVIRGADLQSEGITKNQSFGIDVADKPACEILVEILRLANPDKLATGPADPRQKLVYVVGRETAGGPEAVFVTTRNRAAERGETLPAIFVRPQ